MGIRIIRIKITPKEFADWRNNDGFVCLEEEEYYPTTYAHKFYDEALQDHYQEEADDHDYTFNDWCEDHEIYTKWDINLQYGSDGWEWEVIENKDGEIEWLIIAVKEY